MTFRSGEKYDRAPIIETVLELRVKQENTWANVDKFVANSQSDYPLKEDQVDITSEYNTETHQFKNILNKTGYKLSSTDAADVIIVGRNKVGTGRLAPYPGWEQFVEIAKRNWKVWTKYASSDVVRIGARYVNRIDLPFGDDSRLDLGEYLNLDLGFDLEGEERGQNLISELTIATKIPTWNARIRMATQRDGALIKHLSVLLDIDVYKDSEIPAKNDDLWVVIEEARLIKNDLFERIVTDRTRELFR